MVSLWVGDMVKGNYFLYFFYWIGFFLLIMERGVGFYFWLEKFR